MPTPAFVSIDDLLQYHKKELAAQGEEKRVKIAKAKKVAGGSKAKQKEVTQAIEDEYAPLELSLKERQKFEVESFGKDEEDDGENEQERADPPSAAVASLSLGGVSSAAVPAPAPLPPAISKEEEEEQKRQKAIAKAQEKKAKKKLKDAEAEAALAAELAVATAGPSSRQIEKDAIAQRNNFDGLRDEELLASIKELRSKLGDASFVADALTSGSYAPLNPEEHLLSLQVGRKAIVDVPADGNCLYRSVAAQLQPPGATTFGAVRSLCAKALLEDRADFEHFAELEDGGTFDDYVRTVGDSTKAEWGGELELRALANATGRNIVVFDATGKPIVVRPKNEATAEGKPDIWVSYHKQYYALGEHYNVVRRI